MLEIDFEAKKDYSYDDWLDFFRHIPTDELLRSQETLKKAPVECYAAASRWIEIIRNPSKMDKLYSARLKAKQEEEDIMNIATGDDDEAFYEALIRENVTQLTTSNISQQEVARLTQNINIFRKELRDIRSRKPKKGTILEQVLMQAAKPRRTANASEKRPTKARSKAGAAKKTVKVSSQKEKANASQPEAKN